METIGYTLEEIQEAFDAPPSAGRALEAETGHTLTSTPRENTDPDHVKDEKSI